MIPPPLEANVSPSNPNESSLEGSARHRFCSIDHSTDQYGEDSDNLAKTEQWPRKGEISVRGGIRAGAEIYEIARFSACPNRLAGGRAVEECKGSQ